MRQHATILPKKFFLTPNGWSNWRSTVQPAYSKTSYLASAASLTLAESPGSKQLSLNKECCHHNWATRLKFCSFCHKCLKFFRGYVNSVCLLRIRYVISEPIFLTLQEQYWNNNMIFNARFAPWRSYNTTIQQQVESRIVIGPWGQLQQEDGGGAALARQQDSFHQKNNNWINWRWFPISYMSHHDADTNHGFGCPRGTRLPFGCPRGTQRRRVSLFFLRTYSFLCLQDVYWTGREILGAYQEVGVIP